MGRRQGQGDRAALRPDDGGEGRIEEVASQPAPTAPGLEPCTIGQLLAYFTRLGGLGFGGPIALCGYMQRDLVEQRRWIAKEDYLEGLALSQLAPGPLAAQLAIYLGWVRARVLGATLVGIAFILPSFLMVLGISALYVRYQGLRWIQGAFYGVGAAVIAVIARSAIKLVKMTLAKDWLRWGLFAASAAVTVATQSEMVWVFLGAGVVALLARGLSRPASTAPALAIVPAWCVSGLTGPASMATVWKVLVYFATAGAFVFGSGLAVVPFLHGGVVMEYHWLDERQFIDAVAVAMITPGPVVITVAFIGYLVAGIAGACAAAVGVFLPCYLVVILAAPYYQRLAKVRSIKAFVDGVTAAAIGAIAGSAVVLGRRAIHDWPAALIALTTLVILTKLKKVPEPLVILAAGAVGFLLKGTA